MVLNQLIIVRVTLSIADRGQLMNYLTILLYQTSQVRLGQVRVKPYREQVNLMNIVLRLLILLMNFFKTPIPTIILLYLVQNYYTCFYIIIILCITINIKLIFIPHMTYIEDRTSIDQGIYTYHFYTMEFSSFETAVDVNKLNKEKQFTRHQL